MPRQRRTCGIGCSSLCRRSRSRCCRPCCFRHDCKDRLTSTVVTGRQIKNLSGPKPTFRFSRKKNPVDPFSGEHSGSATNVSWSSSLSYESLDTFHPTTGNHYSKVSTRKSYITMEERPRTLFYATWTPELLEPVMVTDSDMPQHRKDRYCRNHNVVYNICMLHDQVQVHVLQYSPGLLL